MSTLSTLTHAIHELRAYRENEEKIERGKHPSLKSEVELGGILMAMIYSAMGGIAGAIIARYYETTPKAAVVGAIYGTFIALIAYASWPALSWLISTIKKRWPEPNFFSRFPLGQNFLCLMLFAWPLVFGLNHLYPKVMQTLHKTSSAQSALASAESENSENQETSQNRHRSSSRHDLNLEHERLVKNPKASNSTSMPLKNHWLWGATWLGMAFLIGEAISVINLRRLKKIREAKINSERILKKPFRLWMGHSTGELAKLSHGAGIKPHQAITLSLEDAAHNILVLGGIGSGKTTCAMHPLLLQCLDQDCGGLIFDIKGDFQKSVRALAEETNREVITIGVGYQKMNLLSGLTPEIAASFLKSIFLLSNKQNSEGFWIDTATELCRNTLGVLSFVPEHYSLQGLYAYLFCAERVL